MYFRDYKHKYSWNIAGRIITCIARSKVQISGRIVPVKGVGIAKCRKDDIFQEDFGKELSKIRAKAELCKKIENVFIDETKKSSWRKPEAYIDPKIFEEVSLYIDSRTLKNIKTIRVCNMDGKVLGIAKVEE